MFLRIQAVTQVNFLKSRGNREGHTTQSTDSLGKPGLRRSSPHQGVCPGALPPPHITCLSSPLSFSFCFSSLPVPTGAPRKGTNLLLEVGASVAMQAVAVLLFAPRCLSRCLPRDHCLPNKGSETSCKDATSDQLGSSLLLPYCVTLCHLSSFHSLIFNVGNLK